jgi:hypothetical protein
MPLQHEPPPEVERILMMDCVPTRARSGVVSTPSHGWDQAEATAAMALCVSPPPIADGVDELYHQLVEIHAIAATQLVEGARWRCSDSTPSPIWVGIGR